MIQVKSQIEQGVAELGLAFSNEKVEQLVAYLQLLEKWNRVYSLSAIREPSQMAALHVLDSLAAIMPLVDCKTITVLDVGSGGGQPGIPWAIAKPEWQFVLCDSNHKKTSFLRQAVAELGLRNVRIECFRVEQLTGQFDVITSRAFAELRDFVSLTKHLLAETGSWAALKGVFPHEEIERLPEGVIVRQAVPLRVPNLSADRHLILMVWERE
ncbi:16S rRNA (guanine(527)-N(7))-methyltransferase RsmG [Chitinimonas sp. DQS-5]|uniref:Ribosomal RNA small subunit methyltransferase G n=1 Tax=Parachitinimonas caeni TaxID=3031301 RepID=A0ABT7DRX5_9NEIS|nr:16S rRNA (guanine(527)-N(7))-methyltransferase RsmG [Parachitinimonas caeni]MDK2122544.1 16S rRNA (guanine(527)-N(7))-methyltransferase RsmG [Parachitinimonas caeni]